MNSIINIFKSKKNITRGLLALCFILCFFTGYIIAAQPHMQAALTHLNSAKDQLKKATENKGGHRVNAIALIDKAIIEVKKGIEAAK